MAYPFFSLANPSASFPSISAPARSAFASKLYQRRHGHHLGCRRFDLGCQPDRRGPRRRFEDVAPDGGDALQILTFVGRGTSARDYDRLKAALDRLQSTTVLTSIRQPTERRRHRFSWINEWKEWQISMAGHLVGTDLARLVLRRGAARGARATIDGRISI